MTKEKTNILETRRNTGIYYPLLKDDPVRATPTLSSQCLEKVLNLTSMDEYTQLDI